MLHAPELSWMLCRTCALGGMYGTCCAHPCLGSQLFAREGSHCCVSIPAGSAIKCMQCIRWMIPVLSDAHVVAGRPGRLQHHSVWLQHHAPLGLQHGDWAFLGEQGALKLCATVQGSTCQNAPHCTSVSGHRCPSQAPPSPGVQRLDDRQGNWDLTSHRLCNAWHACRHCNHYVTYAPQ